MPINADEGFPQSFRLDFKGSTYRIVLYVNAPEDPTVPLEHIYDLPEGEAFMVMRVEREGPGKAQVMFQRKLVPNQRYEAAELIFVFREMRVARRNLNGIGALGSRVAGGIAARWD
jgi:hypothetical protein